MPSLRPLTARAIARLRRHPPFHDDAAETVELCEQGVQELEPAIFLPGEVERIRKPDEFSSMELQHERITARTLRTLPTLSYRLKDVFLHDGALLTSRNALALRRQSRRPLIGPIDFEADEAMLVSNHVIEHFFGHWLRDGLALEQLAQDQRIQAVAPRRPAWLHEPGYRQRLPWPAPIMTSAARFKSLWLIDDRGLSAHRADRMRRLKMQIAANAAPAQSRRIFMRRGSAGSARALVNEQAVIDHLTTQGFTILSPEACQPAEICTALANAEIVVSVEGSALNHANLAMPSNATLLVIQPPNRFNAYARTVCGLFGQRYAFVVGEPVGEISFSLEPERLQRTIDLVDGKSNLQSV